MCKGHCPATVATQWKPPQPIATTSGPETDAGNHTTTYHYDAQRYTKEYAYDGADTPISVKDANSHTAQHRYDARWGLGTATYNDSTTTVYAYDGPRNPTDVDVKDPAGSVVRFTGKERDSWGENNQLDFFGARYFSSAQGRFTTPDWSEKPEPIPYVDLENPQTLNLYTYGRNNPLRWSDPDGHCTVDGETHGWLWCAAHAIGFTQTVKEQADVARASLAQAHGFTINGQTPAEIAKTGTNQQVIAADRAATSFLLGVAQDSLSPCPPGMLCGVIPIGPPGEIPLPLKNAGTAARVGVALDNVANGIQQYSRDGITFANREGLLPARPLGYYREYTVPPAAGVATRGAKRLIVGKSGEVFYSPDHYKSFVRIK